MTSGALSPVNTTSVPEKENLFVELPKPIFDDETFDGVQLVKPDVSLIFSPLALSSPPLRFNTNGSPIVVQSAIRKAPGAPLSKGRVRRFYYRPATTSPYQRRKSLSERLAAAKGESFLLLAPPVKENANSDKMV